MFRIRRLMALSLLILALAACQSSRPALAPTRTPTAKAPPTQALAAAQTNPTAISAPAATPVLSAAATPAVATIQATSAPSATPAAATVESTSAPSAAPAATSSDLTPQVFIPVAPDQGSNPAATAPAATPAVGASQSGQPTAQATSASPASTASAANAAASASATPAAAGTAAPVQPTQPAGNAPAAQVTGTLPYHQNFPQVGGGALGSPASATAQAGTCQAPSATVHLTSSATQVKVGQPLTLTVQLINQGCPSIETAQYHVAVDGPGWPIGLEPVVPPVVTHASRLPQGQSDTAVFVLRATHAGRPEVSATVNYASGVDARGQTRWTWVPSGPVTVVVTQ